MPSPTPLLVVVLPAVPGLDAGPVPTEATPVPITPPTGALYSPGAVPALKASMIAPGEPGATGSPVMPLTATSSIPGAMRKGVGGWSASAAFMKSRKIGAETDRITDAGVIAVIVEARIGLDFTYVGDAIGVQVTTIGDFQPALHGFVLGIDDSVQASVSSELVQGALKMG